MPNPTEGFRLSAQQASLWSQQQAAGGRTFCALCAVELTGELDQEALRTALGDLIGRHEILRTTFERPPGIKIPFQVVAETLDLSWQTFDIAGLNAAAQQAKIQDCFAEARNQPFDLEHG